MPAEFFLEVFLRIMCTILSKKASKWCHSIPGCNSSLESESLPDFINFLDSKKNIMVAKLFFFTTPIK